MHPFILALLTGYLFLAGLFLHDMPGRDGVAARWCLRGAGVMFLLTIMSCVWVVIRSA